MTVDIAFEPLNVMKGLSAGTVTFSLHKQFGTKQCCQMWLSFQMNNPCIISLLQKKGAWNRAPVSPRRDQNEDGLGVVGRHGIDGGLNVSEISLPGLVDSDENRGGWIRRTCRGGHREEGRSSQQGQQRKAGVSQSLHGSCKRRILHANGGILKEGEQWQEPATLLLNKHGGCVISKPSAGVLCG